METKISALIIAKNEAKNIAECIQSVRFCDEIIVIDDNSSDETVKIATDLGATVYQRAMNGNYGMQQTYAISKAQYPWLLFIDCDERISSQLGDEILAMIKKPILNAYQIKRINYFQDKKVRFGTMRPDYVCRLIPKIGTSVQGKVHQWMQHPYQEYKLKNSMVHFTYQSWDEYYAKFERYTRLSALKYLDEGKTPHFFHDIIIRPIWSFIKMYFIHLGILDGKIGLILAINHSYYTFTKYVRFYYLKKAI